jgi:hypothetical protein
VRRTILRAIALAAILALLVPANVAYADPTRPPHPPQPCRPGTVCTQADEYDPGGGLSTSATESGGGWTCYSESRNPHSSSHVTGNVNAESYIWCAVPTAVTLHATLYKEFAWFWWRTLDDKWASGTTAPDFNLFVNSACQGDLNYRLVTWAYPSGMNSGGSMNTQYVPCQSNP